MANEYLESSLSVIEECRAALKAIPEEQVRAYLEVLEGADKVFFVGVGRVLLALKAVAKRYAHLGIKAVIVGEITEPAITAKDVLIVGSGSGETLFPLGIAEKAKKFGAKVVHIGNNPDSSLRKFTDLFLRIPVESRAGKDDEIRSCQPMTSLFEQSLLLFGDVTAMMIIKERNLDMKQLWEYHANLE